MDFYVLNIFLYIHFINAADFFCVVLLLIHDTSVVRASSVLCASNVWLCFCSYLNIYISVP